VRKVAASGARGGREGRGSGRRLERRRGGEPSECEGFSDRRVAAINPPYATADFHAATVAGRAATSVRTLATINVRVATIAGAPATTNFHNGIFLEVTSDSVARPLVVAGPAADPVDTPESSPK